MLVVWHSRKDRQSKNQQSCISLVNLTRSRTIILERVTESGEGSSQLLPVLFDG